MSTALRPLSTLGVAAVLLVGAGCGSDGDESASAPTTSTTVRTAATLPVRTSTTAPPPPEGVETFQVEPSHTNDTVAYPQTPPVGGPHNPSWQACAFNDRPVASERAVHSLEHGAIWVTYRPDLPADQVEVLARLARSRDGMLVSRWDEGLPAPVVVTSWGRQLKLDSATDPRLLQFAQAFVGQAPEPNGPC